MDKILNMLFEISDDSYDMTWVAISLLILCVLFIICVAATQHIKNEHTNENSVKRGRTDK